jgi:hypothetical protein
MYTAYVKKSPLYMAFNLSFIWKVHPWLEGGEKIEGQVAVSILEAGGCYCLVQLDLPFIEKSL